jgi:predicted RNase H-like nuclease (RuvC/YqgF family)
LEEEVRDKADRTAALKKEVDDLFRNQVDGTADHQDDRIPALEKEVRDKAAHIVALKKEVKDKVTRIADLQGKLIEQQIARFDALRRGQH